MDYVHTVHTVGGLSTVIARSPSADRNRGAYHHGNLREALLEAGLEITRTGGPTALGLRDVTRRVGVSPNAAYRHFADRDRLLHAVAGRIQNEMAAQMAAQMSGARSAPASAQDPVGTARDELRAVGLGYIGFALQEPGWFDVAFGGDVFADPNVAPVTAGTTAGPAPGPTAPELPAPLARLVTALDHLVDAGELDPGRRPGAEWPCWSAVHGFAVLALHGPLRGQSPEALRSAAERTVDAVITGLCDEGPRPRG
jgi:AcrR family transcriptional regulator